METKQKVLEILEQNRGEPISGNMIAMHLGLSRNSVWKAIEKLRAEGFAIEGGSGRGYTLAADSDILSEEGIRHHLSIDMDLRVLSSVDSTNMEAKRLATVDVKTPMLIVANEQTNGSGRNGRSFFSPADSGLYMSFLLQPGFAIDKAPLLTTAAAVSVARAIESVSDAKCRVKWVNDIFIDNKKVCGILTEAVTDFESGALAFVIVGIGINCHPRKFPQNIAAQAGSVGGNLSRNELAAAVADAFLPIASDLDDTGFLDDYRSRSLIIGKSITITRLGSDETHTAKAIDIADNGGLLVRYRDGSEEILTSGEISIRKF